MAYQSLYRKYRSQGFDDLMGQQHVTQTLSNAVANGKVGHAYLFTGPRGTGKTSTARILAKALNCEQGPTASPCGACAACLRIRDGASMDVVEIDAASNRGIDDIRVLREQVGYAPALERTKVFVIDEVHQLTSESFNALLKTLEEPPDRVVFVLATTDPQKVPRTIVSRCQRFDFRRGTLADIQKRLRFVCDAEGLEADDDALRLVARAAAGSWRDALSLLEQVAAYSLGGRIEADAARETLGLVDTGALTTLADAVERGNVGAVFHQTAALFAAGQESRTLLTALAGHFRDLLLLETSGPGTAEAFAPELLPDLKAQAARFGPTRLVVAMDGLAEAEGQLRWSADPRLTVELALVKLACESAGREIASSTGRGAGVSTPPASAPRAERDGRATAGEPSAGRRVAAGRGSTAAAGGQPDSAAAAGATASTPQPMNPEPAGPKTARSADSKPSRTLEAAMVREPADGDEAAREAAADGSRPPHSPDPPATGPFLASSAQSGQEDEEEGRAGDVEAGQGVATSEALRPGGPITIDRVRELWARVANVAEPKSVRPLVRAATPMQVGEGSLLVAVPYPGYVDSLHKQGHRDGVEKAIVEVLGQRLRLTAEHRPDADPPPQGAATEIVEAPKAGSRAARDALPSAGNVLEEVRTIIDGEMVPE